ncbi:MAG: hypothetical protein WCG25_08910, partial [bacterium]
LNYVKAQFMDHNRIFVGRIARRKLNAKLGLSKSIDDSNSDLYDGEDLVASIKYLLNLSNFKK